MTRPRRLRRLGLIVACCGLYGCNLFTPDPPPPPGQGCSLTDKSCSPPMDDLCQTIATHYCGPLLGRKISGAAPTACELASCASSINDQFVAVGKTQRSQLVTRLEACADGAAAGPATDLLRCPQQAITDVAVTRTEMGQIAPSNALTLPGDRAQQVRCAYARCPEYVGGCFHDPQPDGPAATPQDTCRTYRSCLAECAANVAEPLRRGRCVREQCDPVYPAGRQAFLAYRDCMNRQGPECGAMP